MSFEPIPEPILREVVAWQERLQWPDLVPGWAEIPDSTGKVLWHRYEDLTIAECEQATEFYVRRARKAIAAWNRIPLPKRAVLAGRAILWARIFRCRYLQLTGKADSTEADMPFAFGNVQ